MQTMRRSLSRRVGVPWWVLVAPGVTGTLIVVVLLGIVVMGAIAGPSASDAAAAEQNAANGSCTLSPAVAAGSGAPGAAGATPPPGPTPDSAPGSRSGSGSVPTPTGGAADPAEVAGVRLEATQLQNAQTIVGVGKSLNAPVKAMAIALVVSFQDAQLLVTAISAGGVGQGLFLQTSTAYPGVNRADPAAAATAFYTRLLALPAYTGGLDVAQVATSMQGNSAATEVDYQAHAGWAATLAAVLSDGTPGATGSFQVVCDGGATDNTAFAAGNIISDAVFYNTQSMTVDQIRVFIAVQNRACPAGNPWCLKNLSLTAAPVPANRWCAAIPGGDGLDAAALIGAYSTACGVNPQVMLTKLQLESQGLTRADPAASSYAAAWGWNCPDTGPAGTARCDPAHAGFLAQLAGMAKSWAQMKADIPTHRYRYAVGTYDIMWNVEQSGCGSAPVDIKNVATASLYVYTPYQPNAASLAGYPGTGDGCSSYGNRNFFYQFRAYFGSTGGGAPITGSAFTGTGTGIGIGGGGGSGVGIGGPVAVTGQTITLPPAAGITGTITAPTPTVATAITAGLNWLGEPYSWGGGSPAGPTLGICTPGPAQGDCAVVGFDCSGLMMYLWAQVGIATSHYSQDLWASGTQIPFSQALPGDMIGYPGHIALYVGVIGGAPYMLEAPQSGEYVHLTPVRNNPGDEHYPTVSRIWTGH